MQTAARRNDWPLDSTAIVTEVTRKAPDQVDAPPKDGAYVHGFFLEGARWDEKTGALEDSLHKELSVQMPVSRGRLMDVHADASEENAVL
jgi:dynein heavy chain